MMRFNALLVLVTALLVNLASAQLVPTFNDNAPYSVTISDAPAAPVLTGLTNITAGDDRVDYIPMGFQFVFFNRTFNSVNISSNGNIQVSYHQTMNQPWNQ